MPDPTCTLPDCEKPSRNPRSPGLCPMHYHRQYRRGSTDTARPWHRRTVCAVPDCGKPERSGTYCAMHAARVQRHGSTDRIGTRPRYRQDHHDWTGDAATYGTVHDRLRAWRGPARAHRCVDCDRQAHHWSYDHGCPDERTSRHGPYSPHLEHYRPRCGRCHKAHDMRHRRSVTT